MNKKPSLDYLGRVSGNIKQGINAHTVKAEDVMVPILRSAGGSVISMKINLD
jgi:iron-sulfur cluster repair protein YtfE (RIC family)